MCDLKDPNSDLDTRQLTLGGANRMRRSVEDQEALVAFLTGNVVVQVASLTVAGYTRVGADER
jgi:hypothetical protein